MSSGDEKDQTNIIMSTLTELAFLLIYGFMLVDSGTQPTITNPPPPPPPQTCQPGELFDAGPPSICIPKDSQRGFRSCYRQIGRNNKTQDWAIFRIHSLDSNRARIEYKVDFPQTGLDATLYQTMTQRSADEMRNGNIINLSRGDLEIISKGLYNISLQQKNCRYYFSRLTTTNIQSSDLDRQTRFMADILLPW